MSNEVTMSLIDRELLEMAKVAPATIALLQEVNDTKERLGGPDQNFGAANLFLEVEREIRRKLRGDSKSPDELGFSLHITLHAVDLDPQIEVYKIVLENNSGIWPETVPTRENLGWLLKGIEMMTSPGKRLHVEIPRRITSRLVEQEKEPE